MVNLKARIAKLESRAALRQSLAEASRKEAARRLGCTHAEFQSMTLDERACLAGYSYGDFKALTREERARLAGCSYEEFAKPGGIAGYVA